MNNNWVKGQDFGFKVGQKAWHARKGWGTILRTDCQGSNKIEWKRNNGRTSYFQIDGCYDEEDITPSLFHVEQTFDYSRPKWQPEPGELCWVWDENFKTPALAIHVEKSRFLHGDGFVNYWQHCAPFNGGKLPDEFKHLEGGSK